VTSNRLIGDSAADRAFVVLCTVPEGFDAAALAEGLVNQALAACVQIGPRIESVYRWRGATERSAERLLIIKTSERRYEDLEKALRSRHPYEVPQIVALEVAAGHEPYLAWLAAETAESASRG